MDFKIDNYSKNERGRDLIVGDIHGMYSLLNQYLKAIKFNPEEDILYCTGDLVDRGPESAECIKWIKQPWFRSVIGNHDLGVASYNEEVICNFVAMGEFKWFYGIESEDLRLEIANSLAALPGLIEISDGSDKVGIVHASCLDSWETTKLQLEKCDERLNYNLERTLLWERDIASVGFKQSKDKEDGLVETSQILKQLNDETYRVSDVTHVFHGHSINTRDCLHYRVANRYFIDTGAFLIQDKYLDKNQKRNMTPGFTICDLWNPDKPIITPLIFGALE